MFRCGSLCCCVGDCVVGHCHLYPLHSWQDILLTFAEMELDSTTMFPPGTNVTDDDSDLNSDTGVVWVKSARGVWGMGHSFGNKLFFQGTFPKGNGFPKICLRLPSLLPGGQNHHPRVLPKAFQWKVESMCKSSKSSGAGPRKFTPSRSRSRSPYIGSPLNVSYAKFFRFMLQCLCLQMCVYGGGAVPQGGVGDRHLVTIPQGVVGDRLPWGGERQGKGGGYLRWVLVLTIASWGHAKDQIQCGSVTGLGHAQLIGCTPCPPCIVTALA